MDDKHPSRGHEAREKRDRYRSDLRAWMTSMIGNRYPSAQAWADASSVAATTITRFLAREDAPTPTMNTITKLALAAGQYPPGHRSMAIEMLRPGIERDLMVEAVLGDEMLQEVPDNAPAASLASDTPGTVQPTETTSFTKRPLPIYWTGWQDAEQTSLAFAFEEIGTIPRPAPLIGASGAFALGINSNEAFPRYMPGDLLLIDPSIKYYIGSYVIVLTPLDPPRYRLQVGRIRQNRPPILLERLHPLQIQEVDPQAYAVWPIVGAYSIPQPLRLYSPFTGDRMDDEEYRRLLGLRPWTDPEKG